MTAEIKEENKSKSKKPGDGAFRQQRLPAWEPVMTPGTVIPTLYILGILFCPIGGLLWWNSNKVDQIMINYSYCLQYDTPVYMIDRLFEYQTSDKNFNISTLEPPAYSYRNENSFLDPDWGNPNNLTIPRCTIDFTVPRTMKGPIFMYYRLTNFYQNHRQYIKNYYDLQLKGQDVSESGVKRNCDPLSVNEQGKIIYPCGLIANSMFNDTASDLVKADTLETVSMSTKRIAWPSDKKKYGATQMNLSHIVPPPNWASRYPNGEYTIDYPPPDLSAQERFMVWMHVSALPDFRKLWSRNDTASLSAGRWRVSIDMNFDTLKYSGEKWIVLSTTSPMGGRNPYLGIAYMTTGAFCFIVALLFTLRHMIKPRKLGDQSYLSWNQPGGGLPQRQHLHKE